MYNTDTDLGISDETRRQARLLLDEPKDHHLFRWVAIALIAAALVGFGWYNYPALNQMATLPATLFQLPGLQASYAKMHDRVADVESRLQSWAGSQQQLQQQLADVQNQVEARLQAARKQAREMSASVYRRIEATTGAQIQSIQARLLKVESTGQTDQAQIEKLQAELAAVKQTAAQQAEQLLAVRQQMEREALSRNDELASLNQRFGQTSHDMDGLAGKLATKRVEFAVTGKATRGLAPGVTLGITRTDAKHRRVDGWVLVAPDKDKIWFRAREAQEPILFYGQRDTTRRELVITNVTRNSASGYLLIMGAADTNTAAPETQADARPVQ